ncbi:type II toxin-antitoxin system VapC family toxin [Methylovulum psychrotolerans]|uniref:type II toxin-antitoxin system VapC family toxin n=1 Tax=Methylovulum psychrotolerans TaxID=1704499 RepID=UPI001BFF3E35|nr:type II toxin-antitoxin system VapC family toxin [Methylovulum psychrotolerans]
MKSYLLDTNVLIYYFNGDMADGVKNSVSAIMRENFQISVISKMEFLGFPFSLQEKQKAIQFIKYASVKPLSDEVVQRVIDIRQERRIKLPDAIIAATAIQCAAVLVTRNTKDFNGLVLETYNPFEEG